MVLNIGEKYEVKPIKIIQSGVIVQLSDNSTELIHISNLTNKYVKHISDIYNMIDLDKIYVAQAIPGRSRPIELSLKSALISSSNTVRSLDDMIKSAEEVLSDKLSKEDKRRRTYKSRRGSTF